MPSDPMAHPQLPAEEAADILGRVRSSVLTTAGQRRQHRRTVRVSLTVVGGVALFSGGIALGGAAWALGSDDDHALVTVSCYSSADATRPDVRTGYTDAPAAAAVRAAPEAVCQQGRQFNAAMSVVTDEATRLHAQGYPCVEITTTDGHSWNIGFDNTARNANSSECAHETGIAVPVAPSVPSVGCLVDSKNIAVYPLDDRTGKDVCADKHLTAIGGEPAP